MYHAFDNLTFEQFVELSRAYRGPVPDLLAKTSHLRHQLCEFFSLSKRCAPPKQEQDFVDMRALRQEYNAYYPNLTQNILREYAKYNVRHVIIPRANPTPTALVSVCLPVYQDQYFTACKINLDIYESPRSVSL